MLIWRDRFYRRVYHNRSLVPDDRLASPGELAQDVGTTAS
jgi:hypothetical protein